MWSSHHTHMCICICKDTQTSVSSELGFTFHMLSEQCVMLHNPLPLMFDAAFTYTQLLNKYLLGIKEENPSSVLVLEGSLSSKQELLHPSPVWGDKSVITGLQSTALGDAIQKHLRQKPFSCFPCPVTKWVMPCWVIFIQATVLCYLIGMSLITQWTKLLNWNVPCPVREITNTFLWRLEQSCF